MLRTVFVANAVSGVFGQNVGTQKTENHPKLTVQECTKSGGCITQQRAVVIDANWRWTHTTEGATNCYTGNQWSSQYCPDADTCTKNCAIEGADEEYTNTYGVFANGAELTLNFVTQGPYSTNIGSRVYLLEDEQTYKLFHLKNKEFSFDVDDSNLPCGLNGALYFSQMDADGGMSKYPTNKAGAKYGTGYCDAQCPHDIKFINGQANMENWQPSKTDQNSGTGKYGSCCTEFDMWEGNSISTAYTAHSCNVTEQTRCDGVACGDNDDTPGGSGGHRFDGVCDKNGCDLQTFRMGQKSFYGPGSDFTIDSTKPVRVTTQFITDDGTDAGSIIEVRRTFRQGDAVVEIPSLDVGGKQYSSVSPEYCESARDLFQDGTNFLEKGGFGAVDISFEKGMVLALSLWDDHYANMLWLDSCYPTDSDESVPGVCRGTCDEASGKPSDVEGTVPNAFVRYMNIRYGEIGSTDPMDPVPGPSPGPSPSPGAGNKCCYADPDQEASCSAENCLTEGWCVEKEDQCTGACNGLWCPADVPSPPTPAPSPTPVPSPSPSDCPGGSLNACIDLCPPEVFTECVQSCQRRCPSEITI